jgi:hypothetical protein
MVVPNFLVVLVPGELKKTRNTVGCTMAIDVEVHQINWCIGTTKNVDNCGADIS